jgi:hypothetical protein
MGVKLQHKNLLLQTDWVFCNLPTQKLSRKTTLTFVNIDLSLENIQTESIVDD